MTQKISVAVKEEKIDDTLMPEVHVSEASVELQNHVVVLYSDFSCMFLNPKNSNCSDLLDMRNLLEQVKKAFCYQKLF